MSRNGVLTSVMRNRENLPRLVIVVLPMAAVAAALASEAAVVYARLESGELNPALYFRGVFDALPSPITAVLDRFGLVSFNTLQRRLTAALGEIFRGELLRAGAGK